MFLLVQHSHTLHSVSPHLSGQQLGKSVESVGQERKIRKRVGNIRDSYWLRYLECLSY